MEHSNFSSKRREIFGGELGREGWNRGISSSPEDHGTRAPPHSPIYIRRGHRNAPRNVGRQDHGEGPGTQLEWLLRGNGKSLSGGDSAGSKSFHGDGVF